MRAPSRSVLITAGAALLIVGAAGCSGATGAAADPAVRTITASATGTATGVPDTAIISLGADSRGATATEALATNAQRVAGVIDAMRFVGVKTPDIQTSGITLYPTFDTRGRITGYTVSTRMTAKTHDVPDAGKVIDAAAKLAGDDLRVDNISLTIEDTGPVVRSARKRAVEAAHDEAAQLARAATVKLGRARTIVEERDLGGSFPESVSLRAATFDSSIPVSAGTQDLQIRVKVVYEIS